jgi:predicted MFS family arabinose efflux permease
VVTDGVLEATDYSAADRKPLPRSLVALMAVACASAIANMYYAQPLLDAIAASLHVAPATAGFVITATQIGYLLGILFVVPLGDLLNRRRLVSRVLLLTALALACTAAAPSLIILAAALAVVGVSSVVAQILIPFAHTIAAPGERGRVAGTITAGVLVGILLARTVSGTLAAIGGWRLVFALAAGGMLVLSVVLARALPDVPSTHGLRYPALLRSSLDLVRDEPMLRRRMIIGALGFCNFTMFWTSLTFLLSGPPYDYGEGTIGLFGLVGLAGALAAQIVGRLADRGWVHRATGACLVVVVISRLTLGLADTSLIALLVGIVLLDFGIQGNQVATQNVIYGLRSEARGRITTVYVSSSFIGGAIGSALASVGFAAGGWELVNGIAIGLAVATLLVWSGERLAVRREAHPG